MWPRLIDAVRLTLGSAWLYLIAAEAMPPPRDWVQDFPVRRYLAMDVILPYVIWITLLAFTMDWALKLLRSRAFRGPTRAVDPWRACQSRICGNMAT